MLQREGFVVADMSASAPSPSLLRRSSWKAEAIRKGNLKISGPIPITEDMPLNDEEEKKFAENGTLMEVSQPPDTPLQEQHPGSVTPSRPAPSTPAVPEHPMPLRSNLVGEQSQQEEEVRDHPPVRSPHNLQPVNVVQRDSVIPRSALASPTPFRSTPESAAAKATQKKRKSGLRGVFRKMFGKKTAEPEHQQQRDETARRGHSYHSSDPGLLRSTPPIETRASPSPAGPRISGLPVKELEPLHPLGQHLPYPMNVNAPPASPPQEYLTFDVNRPDLSRRRATLPTVPSAVVHRRSLDESRPKMGTWEERFEEEEMSPSGIGIAVSSPSQGTPKPNKRRSRSADALHDMARELASTERRRSAEIKYWRQSYRSGSVYSRPETAKTVEEVETLRSVQMQEPTIQEPATDSFNEMSAMLVQADDPQTPTSPGFDRAKQQQHEKEGGDVHVAVSDFNFGDFKGAGLFGPAAATATATAEPEPEPEPEPKRDIEPAAQPGSQEISPVAPLPAASNANRLSMEERLLHLESKYSNLETLTHRLSSRNNRQTIILENAPRSLRSRDRSTSVSASRSHSRSAPSIHQEPPHLRQQSTSGGEHVEEEEQQQRQKDSSATSPPKTLQDMHTMLQAERSARIALEHHVQTLQSDISHLHALLKQLIASNANPNPTSAAVAAAQQTYPTPSPDMLIMSSSEDPHRMSCSTPRALSRNRDHHHPYYAQHEHKHEHEHEQRGWRHDSESMYSDDIALGSSSGTEDVASPDEWATPKEEGFAGSGFFRCSADEGVRAYA